MGNIDFRMLHENKDEESKKYENAVSYGHQFKKLHKVQIEKYKKGYAKSKKELQRDKNIQKKNIHAKVKTSFKSTVKTKPLAVCVITGLLLLVLFYSVIPFVTVFIGSFSAVSFSLEEKEEDIVEVESNEFENERQYVESEKGQ